MQASDEIRAATDVLKRQAAIVRQAFLTPAPEDLANDEVLAWEKAGDAAHQEWKLELARILFEMYEPDADPRLSCCCGGYHVVAQHQYPEDGEREILVGPCQTEEEIEARVAVYLMEAPSATPRPLPPAMPPGLPGIAQASPERSETDGRGSEPRGR